MAFRRSLTHVPISTFIWRARRNALPATHKYTILHLKRLSPVIKCVLLGRTIVKYSNSFCLINKKKKMYFKQTAVKIISSDLNKFPKATYSLIWFVHSVRTGRYSLCATRWCSTSKKFVTFPLFLFVSSFHKATFTRTSVAWFQKQSSSSVNAVECLYSWAGSSPSPCCFEKTFFCLWRRGTRSMTGLKKITWLSQTQHNKTQILFPDTTLRPSSSYPGMPHLHLEGHRPLTILWVAAPLSVSTHAYLC